MSDPERSEGKREPAAEIPSAARDLDSWQRPGIEPLQERAAGAHTETRSEQSSHQLASAVRFQVFVPTHTYT